MENKNTTDMHDEIEIMARRSESAIKRILEPHIMRLTGKPLRKVKYVVTSNNNLVQTLPYVGMPRFMRHWSHGKQAQHWLDQTSSHFFELVLNDDPCTCYLSVNNRLPMQGLVIAHAIGGHMVFFQLNRLFEDTMPETVVKRFAQQDEKTNALISDAKFGIRKVERIVDAARAVQQHVPRVPQPKILATEGPDAGRYIPQPVATEKEVKERLHDELAELEHLIATKGASSNFWFDHYTEKKHQVVEALRRHPFEPTYDLLGFVLDPVNSPHLSDKERMLVNFVRDQSLYFQPQGRTKRMNEGFASFMEKYILQQPEVSLSFDLEFDLAHYWTMHLKNPLGKYYDPYTLGLKIWNHVFEMTKGETQEKISIEVNKLGRDANGKLIETDEVITSEAEVHNFDKLIEILHTHDDQTFTREYMTHELIEELNLESLEWCIDMMTQINKTLLKMGWSRALTFSEMPTSVEDKLQQIMIWMGAAQKAAQAAQWYHTPRFPINPRYLQMMGQILQIIMSYNENKNVARRSLIRQGIAPNPPMIKVSDTGRHSDGVWTIQHDFDEAQGPLLQSEAKQTLSLYKRLSPSPMRLVTMEEETDAWGRSTGKMVPYQYFTDDGITVLEGWI